MENVIKKDLYIREKYLEKIRGFYHEGEIIKVISGVRRCGKSSLMKMIIQELLASGISEQNIIYLNLDKRPYMRINNPDQLDKLIEEKMTANGTKYLFIDEIQNVKGFEIILNSWREEGNISIFITGSNSYLLSGELATKLTGRYIEVNMLPLSFEEYLEMKKMFGKSVSENRLIELNKYIMEGGFPYAVQLDSMEDKRTYVQNLIEEIYKKDIQKRIKIKNRSVFDIVMKYLINNFGSTTSVTNIVNDLKKNGIIIKRETVHHYILALLNAKILCECERFDSKSRKSLSGEKKYYLSDLSFYYALNTDNRINYGPALENVFYIYAKSNGCNISVGKVGKYECDFIVRKDISYAYFQIAYTILASKETEDREYNSLEKIVWDNYPKFILTTDYIFQHRNGIIHENIMEFIERKKNV